MSKKKKKKLVKQPRGISESYLNKIFIAILFILPLIYFAPFLSGNKMIAGSDWLLAGYANWEWTANSIKSYGSAPLWNPDVFGGLPADNPYRFNTFLSLILPPHIAFTYLFILAIFFAGLGLYLFLRELKFSLYTSFFCAIAYMGVGSLLSMTYPGHIAKVVAAAFFPFILLFLHRGLLKHKLIYFLIAGALGGFAATNGHFQLIYYAGWVCGFYLLFHLIWHRKENGLGGSLKLIGYSISALILAGGLVAIKYLPIFGNFGWGSRGGLERGYEFATSWSLPPSELLDLLTPHFSGLLNNYWGENWFKLDTQYIGILPLLLAFIGIAVKYREKYVKFFIGLGIVTTIFAFGGYTPLYRIFYYLLPGVKKFRGPAMIFYLTAFSTIVLAAFGIQFLINTRRSTHDRQKSMRKLVTYLSLIFVVVAIFTLICLIAKSSILTMLKSHFQPIIEAKYGPGIAQQKMSNLEQNYPYFLRGLSIALFLIAINSMIIALLKMKKLRLGTWILIAIPILIFDQWTVEKQFLKSVPHPKEYYSPDEVVNFLTKDRSIYRVFPLYYEHRTDSYLRLFNIQSVGGYVSNPYHRYQDLIGAGKSVMFNPPNLVRYGNLLDILNVKYVIGVWIPEDLSQYDEKTQETIQNFKQNFAAQWGVSWEEAHKGLYTVFVDKRGYAVYENKSVLPRVWLASKYEILDENEVLERMKGAEFNPRELVILEEDPGVPPQDIQSDIGNVRILSYEPNKIICEASLQSPGFLILSENWHPDWKAYVDGKASKIFIADYILRAIWLDKGDHEVRFVCDSKYFRLGAWISFLSLLFFVGTLVYWGMRLSKEKKLGLD